MQARQCAVSHTLFGRRPVRYHQDVKSLPRDSQEFLLGMQQFTPCLQRNAKPKGRDALLVTPVDGRALVKLMD
jgi:hypothetical protein